MADKDKDKELTDDEKAKLQGEREAAQEAAARGGALPTDRMVDRPSDA
jgi:hypothetical protein